MLVTSLSRCRVSRAVVPLTGDQPIMVSVYRSMLLCTYVSEMGVLKMDKTDFARLAVLFSCMKVKCIVMYHRCVPHVVTHFNTQQCAFLLYICWRNKLHVMKSGDINPPEMCLVMSERDGGADVSKKYTWHATKIGKLVLNLAFLCVRLWLWIRILDMHFCQISLVSSPYILPYMVIYLLIFVSTICLFFSFPSSRVLIVTLVDIIIVRVFIHLRKKVPFFLIIQMEVTRKQGKANIHSQQERTVG